MGIREIRFCDISGSETDVTTHELHIDQLRVEIDLADVEYRKLLDILRPYMDAGRLEASAPDTAALPRGPRAARRAHAPAGSGLTADERSALRAWAETQGIRVPDNNRFKTSLVEQWRRESSGSST